MRRLRINPVRALVTLFAVVISLGTVALRQPWATVPGKQLRWVEALFTATSATCVTGLVVPLPEEHTVAGQVVIAALIQIGGLEIMTFGLFFLLLLGGRMSILGRQLLLSSLALKPWEDFWPLLRTVMLATGLVEGVGAAFLVAGWWGDKGWNAIPWGVFHSVSAFCNAGFELHAASLAPWRGNPWIALTVGTLVLIGGIGFLPVTEVIENLRRGRRRPLSLHTRMVLGVTAGLLAIGWAGFAVLEWRTTLAGLPPVEKAVAVWLQGLVPRTAGFASLDLGAMTPATLLFFMALMFVGRVGPLTLGLTLLGRQPRVEPRYADEELLIG